MRVSRPVCRRARGWRSAGRRGWRDAVGLLRPRETDRSCSRVERTLPVHPADLRGRDQSRGPPRRRSRCPLEVVGCRRWSWAAGIVCIGEAGSVIHASSLFFRASRREYPTSFPAGELGRWHVSPGVTERPASGPPLRSASRRGCLSLLVPATYGRDAASSCERALSGQHDPRQMMTPNEMFVLPSSRLVARAQ